MRAVFFGTPELAVPALEALNSVAQVVGVVCQPDRPAGRGLKLTPPPVKVAAHRLGLEVHQPIKVKTGTLDEWLRERNADVSVVLAYGRILPPQVLATPTAGCLNLHASLLPKYRGAAPIQWAIIRGEDATGISLMQMDEGLDTGPVYTRHSLSIGATETAGELAGRISLLAADVVRQDVPRVVQGELSASPQDDGAATHAPPLQSSIGAVDWMASAVEIDALIRGLSPRPGAFTELEGARLKLLRSRVDGDALEPGLVALEGRRVFVGSENGRVELLEAQLPGRKPALVADLVNGRALRDGMRLGARQ